MRAPLTLVALPLALLVACGADSVPDPGSSTGGSTTGQSGSMSGGTSSAGTASGSAGKAAGGAGATSGAPASGGSASGGQTGSGGSLSSGGALGTAGTGGGGSGGAGSGGCTRELLKATKDAYFKALATHDPSTLPLADNLKFTENGKASKVADGPLWKTAGALVYSQSAIDTETCNIASEAVVPDGTKDVPLAVRLKLLDQKITEIETIVVRASDYTAVTANPKALIALNDTIKWEEVVPADKRNTRAEITGWMTKYFRAFPMGVCNTTSTCKRIENGGGNFTCGAGASCTTSTTGMVLNPRLVFADVETGIGIGFTLFTGGYADMHMFKMYGGEVHAVSAILANATSTGWD